jgi:hypothetical protein
MRWHGLDSWISSERVTSFTAAALANELNIGVGEASALIQDYLAAQRNPLQRTGYVLRREGRTRGAVWYVGHRTQDMRRRGEQFVDDTRCAVMRAFKPDLEAIGMANPRARVKAERAIEAMVDGALVVMAAAVDGAMPEEE